MTDWTVEGVDETPDGRRDHLLYTGDSWWQALVAIRAARRNDMSLVVTRLRERIGMTLVWKHSG